MTNTRIFGYADPLCARAGSSVDFMISVEGRDEVKAHLVRVLHGDENPEGPGYVEEAVDIALPASLKVKRQFTQVGSFARADDPEGRLDGLASFTLFAHVFPTLPKAERIKKENARFVLPQATMTEINISGNLQAWLDFVNLRTDKAAQWEIREVALEIKRQLAGIAPRIFGD